MTESPDSMCIIRPFCMLNGTECSVLTGLFIHLLLLFTHCPCMLLHLHIQTPLSSLCRSIIRYHLIGSASNVNNITSVPSPLSSLDFSGKNYLEATQFNGLYQNYTSSLIFLLALCVLYCHEYSVQVQIT